MTQASGELFDLGYQHYDGPREGRMRARKAVFTDGIKTILGVGHGSLAKVLPVLLFGAAMTPAVIMAIIASMFEVIGDVLPGHADHYQVVSIVLIIFAALVAPELLCPDRRNGVISLYLVRPLTTTDYVIARWLAFFSITLLLVYSGQAVLLASLILSADEPLDYLKDNWKDIPRILAAGLLVAIFITTLPLAISAFTNRRAIAAAVVIGLFIISSAAAGILTECDEGHNDDRFGNCEPLTGDSAKWCSLVDIGRVPTNVNNMIFDVEEEGERSRITAELPRFVPIAWYVLLSGGLATVLWWRYRKLSA